MCGWKYGAVYSIINSYPWDGRNCCLLAINNFSIGKENGACVCEQPVLAQQTSVFVIWNDPSRQMMWSTAKLITAIINTTQHQRMPHSNHYRLSALWEWLIFLLLSSPKHIWFKIPMGLSWMGFNGQQKRDIKGQWNERVFSQDGLPHH